MNKTPLFSPSVPEDWAEIRDFPTYAVSTCGRVRRELTKRIVAPTKNTRGNWIIGLMDESRMQRKRSLPLLVADAFVPRIEGRDDFDTPIHLDGDPDNMHYLNLAWRPLWFARKYKQQFARDTPAYPYAIEDVETRVFYKDSREAAIIHGLLEQEIRLSMINNTYVFPSGQIFRDAVV